MHKSVIFCVTCMFNLYFYLDFMLVIHEVFSENTKLTFKIIFALYLHCIHYIQISNKYENAYKCMVRFYNVFQKKNFINIPYTYIHTWWRGGGDPE